MNFNIFEMFKFIAINIFFMFKLPYFWSVGAFSCWLLGPFDTTLMVFNGLFAFWHNKMFRLILYISSPRPRINYFFKELL